MDITFAITEKLDRISELYPGITVHHIIYLIVEAVFKQFENYSASWAAPDIQLTRIDNNVAVELNLLWQHPLGTIELTMDTDQNVYVSSSGRDVPRVDKVPLTNESALTQDHIKLLTVN